MKGTPVPTDQSFDHDRQAGSGSHRKDVKMLSLVGLKRLPVIDTVAVRVSDQSKGLMTLVKSLLTVL